MDYVISGIGHAGLPLYTKHQLAESASIKDGLEPQKEVQWRRQYTYFIVDVGKALEVPQWVIYTGVFLCHHYFAKRSMKRNDRYLVATACLYLACKVQEHPKYLRDVIKHAEIKKWGKWQREHPAEPRKWEDPVHLEAMRDQVLVAERAVLYTVCFQLRIKHPYNDLLAWQNYLCATHRNDLFNIAWSFANDSLMTTLSLVYPPEKIAATCLFLAHEMCGLPLPSKGKPVSKDAAVSMQHFCQQYNITDQELQEISEELLDIYITVLAKDSIPGTPGRSGNPGHPTSPDTHLQLQENRVRLLPHQRAQPPLQRPPSRGPQATPLTPKLESDDQPMHEQQQSYGQGQQPRLHVPQQAPQHGQHLNGSIYEHSGS